MTSELHSAVVQWFKLFPEFRSNPLHIFGESYGAKYAIQLAMKIHETNDFLDQALKVGGFKGAVLRQVQRDEGQLPTQPKDGGGGSNSLTDVLLLALNTTFPFGPS